MAIAVFLDVFSLFLCAILSTNRLRTLVAASFVYSVIIITEIPVVCFIAALISQLISMPSLYEIAAQFPQLYYSGLFVNNAIITVCYFAYFLACCLLYLL
jgi:hypothetical protein